ncbi:MAG: hypothetical protein BroJett018_50260 [Chloroflexota bacterium]|nr:hypothetical protein [Chloroflexota bacterium]NOG64370.1 hypothetical protein [Chloroflexota bacterium]GIK67232.1 MAG: hypothetical protein BroJett018_50260 [Chloroflexota bacterium]
MKQHKVVGLKDLANHIVAQTAGVFYSNASYLVTDYAFVRASLQIHHGFTILSRTGPYLRSHPGFVFQINVSGSEKGGAQHKFSISVGST